MKQKRAAFAIFAAISSATVLAAPCDVHSNSFTTPCSGTQSFASLRFLEFDHHLHDASFSGSFQSYFGTGTVNQTNEYRDGPQERTFTGWADGSLGSYSQAVGTSPATPSTLNATATTSASLSGTLKLTGQGNATWADVSKYPAFSYPLGWSAYSTLREVLTVWFPKTQDTGHVRIGLRTEGEISTSDVPEGTPRSSASAGVTVSAMSTDAQLLAGKSREYSVVGLLLADFLWLDFDLSPTGEDGDYWTSSFVFTATLHGNGTGFGNALDFGHTSTAVLALSSGARFESASGLFLTESSSVPEPSGLFLLAAAGLGLLSRHGKRQASS